jgi:hypothetical protein
LVGSPSARSPTGKYLLFAPEQCSRTVFITTTSAPLASFRFVIRLSPRRRGIHQAIDNGNAISGERHERLSRDGASMIGKMPFRCDLGFEKDSRAHRFTHHSVSLCGIKIIILCNKLDFCVCSAGFHLFLSLSSFFLSSVN